MKELTNLQVKSFKEILIKFNNDLMKKNKVKNDFDDDYEKHKIKSVKDIKYLSDDFVYEDIRCLFNETNDIKSNEIKSFEAKSYEAEYCDVKSNNILSYEIDYIDIKPHEINDDYCIENIKNKFNKLFNKLVEANTKDIRCIIDHINNGVNLKETPINLEDIRDKFIAYNDILPFGILSKLSYIDLRKMSIIYSVTCDDEFKTLETKALKSLKMLLLLSFLKYISEEELSEKTYWNT